MKKLFLFAWALIVLLMGCSSGKGLDIRDAWARSGIAGGNSAIYVQVTNDTSEDLVLLRVESDAAVSVELHKSMMEGDIMIMEPQPDLPLPAGKTVDLKPGGLHIMLVGLQHDLNPGDEITVNLVFDSHEPVQLTVPVKQP